MRLLLHQFRKDFRQTWIIWALWLFFVLVQFGLAAWTVNPSDLMGAGIYGQIIGMVPAIHAILLFVLIPLLIFQEPPVGTTASWLTRPMPVVTVLGSKLISFGILVLFPLLGQCVVLLAHHVVLQDVVLAGIEIALKELTWISLATGLAVLCPNFGTFLVAAAALYVLQYFSGWIWSWLDLLHVPFLRSNPGVSSPFIGQSRIVVCDLLCIAFGLSVVFLQYLTRKTRLALALGIVGLLASGFATRYWSWDFVDLLAKKSVAEKVPFDVSALRFVPNGHNSFQQPDPRGGANLNTFSIQFNVSGLPPGVNLALQSEGGEQTFADGSKLVLKPNVITNPYGNYYSDFGEGRFGLGRYGNGNGSMLAGVGKAIGDFPILNQPIYGGSSYGIQDLFTTDSSLSTEKITDPGTAAFRIKGQASGYRIVAEIPLKAGEFFANQSRRTTLTGIFKRDDGVNLELRERVVNLLLAPSGPNQLVQPIYLLLNRKRGEALWSDNNGPGFYNDRAVPAGLLSGFDLQDNRFEAFTPINLSFHSQQGDLRPLPVPVDGAWLADAVLVRVEPESRGDFTTTVNIPDFALDGHTLPNGGDERSDEPDLAALRRIVLPPNPTRPQVWRYITDILYVSMLQRNSNNDDPQVEMLAKVGPEHATDLLIAATLFQGYEYCQLALKSMDLTNQDDAKKMLFRLLPANPNLLDLVTANHWENEAKPILMARLANRRPGETIDDKWLDVLALSGNDPAVKAALLDLLHSQQNVIRIVIGQHWESDAKPILVSIIARTKPGSPIDDRWVKVLDSFHDDSNVKAMLLRVLPSNQGAIETVVQNHWEMDAKPILLETLNNAKKGTNIDERWFTVLAALPDQTGVKEAVLRVLPFSPNAIGAVIQNHWEIDALPGMLETLSKVKTSGSSINEKWFQALNTVANQPGVKEAVLRVLPLRRNAIVVVTQNHWESDAKPVLLEALEKARPGDSLDEKWFQALGALSSQPEVKEAVLRALPRVRSAIVMVIQNHWEMEAQPILLDTLNKAQSDDLIDERWFQVLDSLRDKTEYKKAVLKVLPFTQNAVATVVKNHWEKEAQPIVLEVLAKAKSDKRFVNQYIALAAAEPKPEGLKEAILNILPANEEAIDFVVQNHWEADAKPILLKKLSAAVFGNQINRKWIQALASAGDASIYPLLLAYTENKLSSNRDWDVVDDIRPLPASMVRPLVERAWKAVQETDNEHYALLPVAKWGFTEVLDRSAAILSEPLETDKQKVGKQQLRNSRAREAFGAVTPSPDKLLGVDLAAWYASRKAQLGFDPGLNRFDYHPKAIPVDQSWPSANETMKAIGLRVLAGDAGAFAEIEATIGRATEGLDPKRDAEKIRNIRGSLGNAAFSVLLNEVEKNPDVLGRVDMASQQPGLSRFVVAVYGKAAAGGSDAAIEALIHYQARQWELGDVIGSLGGAVSKESPKAIAFLGSLAADPNNSRLILERASYVLLATANGGNEAAREAYRALQKAVANLKDQNS